MKVMHIMKELRPSGAEVMLKLAAPLWIEGGCDLHVVATAPKTGEFAPHLEKVGYTVHHVPLGRGKDLPRSLITYFKFLKSLEADIVHVHGEGLSLFTCVLASLTGARCFRTIHNNFLFDGRVRLQKRIERLLARTFGCRMIAISDSVKENEMQRFGNPTTLLRNWFDSENFSTPSPAERAEARKKLQIADGDFLIVSVGNGSEIKNYTSIIEAVSRIGNHRIKYLQVGNEYPPDRTTRDRLRLQSQVDFCGPRLDVKTYLHAADLYAMPSHFEGLPLAAVEALASGCVCLFSKSPGLMDFEALGLNIIWTETHAESIHEGILATMALTSNQTGGIQNSQIVKELFSVDKLAEGYLAFWGFVIR